MANDNAGENKRQDFEEIDIDIVEKQLQDQLDDQLSDFEFIKSESEKLVIQMNLEVLF